VLLAILLAGCSLASVVLAFGIRNSKNQAKQRFELDATDVVTAFQSSWGQYQQAALWAYQSGNSSDLFVRNDFYETSENLLSLGLVYEQIGYCVKVLHNNRSAYEEKARASYAKLFPGTPYPGILGIAFDTNKTRSSTGFQISIREERPYYYPCPYQVFPLDPRLEILRAADAYRSNNTMEESLAVPGEPVLSNPLLIRDPDNPDAIIPFVTLMHPGRHQKFISGIQSFATITVRPDKIVQTLLEAQSHAQAISMYIYDTSNNQDDLATGFNVFDVGQKQHANNQFLVGATCSARPQENAKVKVEFLPERSMDAVKGIQGRNMVEKVVPIWNRNWTVIIVSTDDKFGDEKIGLIVLTSSMILVVTIGAIVWLWSVQNRQQTMERIQRTADAEKTALILQNAKRRVDNERELNEVRIMSLFSRVLHSIYVYS
jgi:hypothetical protein